MKRLTNFINKIQNNTQQVLRHLSKLECSDMEEILINLGFEDITKEFPPKFIECLPIGFENVYPISKRFKRTHDELKTYILIGNEHDLIMGYGDSYYKNRWSRFHFAAPKKYFKEQFLSLLKVNENKVIKSIE